MKKPAIIYVFVLVVSILVLGAVLCWRCNHTGYQMDSVDSNREFVKMDLNTASADQLQYIPGVGPTLSNRIIQYREENGPFTKVEEILNVSGVSTRLLAEFLNYTTVGE